MPSTTKIDRRAAIQTLLKGGLALGLMPGFAETAWSAIAAGGNRPAPRALNADQTQMIALIAEVILPRSDTPGATDVGVPAWIDLVVADYFSDARRAAFLADLGAIDQLALSTSGARLIGLKNHDLMKVMSSLDAATGSKDLTPAQRGYVQLKELVIYGYFTSMPVQQDLLKVVVVPGRFDADVRIPASPT
jgi:glucoside 3-dehydrogenase (cytochrome c) hitch-hiker subunit